MKSTMNKRDIAKYHKLLAADVSVEKISRYLGVDKATLKRFAPKVEKAAPAKKAAE